MKKLSRVLAIIILTTRVLAQSNEPVRLALITETDEAAAASDVLTAQLSGNQKIHLLERNEIEKVYREQGLSAANKDYLKLGRILGADGLLLFNVVRTKQATNLTARLIAVKPGVVLTDGSFRWPLKDTTSWAESVATYLNSFLPKLALLPKDAIPISVVNLRSAVQSAEAQETERQLKLLAIQRLSQERQFFVLERQRMQLLGEEKELKADESAFWNGSYLLEGVVDQNGYSKDVITINARLTPSKGGAPLQMEVSGSRTNFAEVINRLAAKVAELLKVSSAVKEWKATDEAHQYYDEAKWALKWGVYSEAQAAADSAWALGKRDLDCALVRVKSYVLEVSAKVAEYEFSEETYTPGGYDANGAPTGPPPSEAEILSGIRKISGQHTWGMAYKEIQYESKSAKTVLYTFANKPPDARNIDRAMHALELYHEFSRTSSADILKVASATSNWRNSDWYNLGIEDLVAASQVLQNFNFVRESQKPVADKLGELRALARSVAGWISQSPSVHDSYFVGDRTATHDELGNTIEESPNVFRCEVKWGCYWQEKPEDGIALYRELMSSPVFSYIHKDLWLRDLQTPRLTAWNENDRQHIPMAWTNFIRELETSTNVLWQLEAKALALADTDGEKKTAESFTNLFNCIFENRDVLVANSVEVLYLNWDVDDLVNAKTSGGIVTDTKDSLHNLFYSEYRPKLEAMDREYWAKTVPAAQFLSVFEQQKQFLKEKKPYVFMEFAQTFGTPDYSSAQALEIQPLLAAYKSNLVAQSQNASGIQKGQLMGAIAQVGFLENDVNRILNPPAAQPHPQEQAQAPQPAAITKALITPAVPATAPEFVTNVIVANKFLAIPGEKLIPLDSSERIEYLHVTITAHHWFEGKLLLDYEYYAGIQWLDEKGKVMGGRNAGGPAIAILDPAAEHWEVIDCPKVEIQRENNFYHRSTLLHNQPFISNGGQIQKYDFQNKQWQVLAVADGNNYELFAINDHLYAASRDMIFEILDGGKSTRILASTRRNPPTSILDRENLGTPTLFEGPNHSLRVSTPNKIFTWIGNDWRENSAAPPASFPPEIFMDGVLFRQAADGLSQPSLSFLATETNAAELCLGQKVQAASQANFTGFSRPDANTVHVSKPLWELPSDLFLANLPAAWHQDDLYLLVDHSEVQEIANDQHEVMLEKVIARDGYNAILLCFTRDLPLPQKVFLKFDAPDGCPPVTGINPSSRQLFPALPPAWMLFTTNFLICGLEKSKNVMPNGAERIGLGYKAGIWMIPLPELEPAISAEQQKAIAKTSEEKKLGEQRRRAFLLKYDKNHNGTIDPDEEEAAMNDPYFIKYKSEQIHAPKRQ
jgi:hypothetical protein